MYEQDLHTMYMYYLSVRNSQVCVPRTCIHDCTVHVRSSRKAGLMQGRKNANNYDHQFIIVDAPSSCGYVNVSFSSPADLQAPSEAACGLPFP